MSSKRAMRQAQKQAYAKHRSNITNSRLELKKKFLTKNKDLTDGDFTSKWLEERKILLAKFLK